MGGVNTLAGRKARGKLKGLKHPVCVCVRVCVLFANVKRKKKSDRAREVITSITQMCVCFNMCVCVCHIFGISGEEGDT